MNLSLYFNISLKEVKNNKRRALISIVAIAIGVFSMILLTSISKGVNESAKDMLKGFGSRTVVVIPLNVGNAVIGSASAGFAATRNRFYESDADKLKSVEGVYIVSKSLNGRATVMYNNESISSTIYAVETDVYNIFAKDLKIKEGRWLRKNSYEVVLGNKVKDSFSKEVRVGKKITISGKEFKVVGILEETGNSLSQLDNIILMPYDKGREIFKAKYSKGEISAILISIKEGYNIKEVKDRIEKKLLRIKKVKEKDKFFTLISRDFIENSVGQITSLLNIFFVSLSLISIIVGLIGVGNTIYMTIIEKTREIGTLRAVGMKRKEVLELYLFQGIILALGGFIAGLLFSIICIEIIKVILPASIDWFFVGIALIFSIGGTLISSYYPAKKASSIPPAEALVYE